MKVVTTQDRIKQVRAQLKKHPQSRALRIKLFKLERTTQQYR